MNALSGDANHRNMGRDVDRDDRRIRRRGMFISPDQSIDRRCYVDF